MKKYALGLMAVLFSFTIQAQEEAASTPAGGSLIDDIMNVETVSVNLLEGHEEAKAKYEEQYNDVVAKLDEANSGLNENYKKEVGSLIEEFTEVLNEGDEKETAKKKKSVASRIRTLSMTLKKDKKLELQKFSNALVPLIRELPKLFHESKTQEMKDKTVADTETIESEFNANISSLEGFIKKEHLKVEAIEASASSSDQ